MHRPRGSSPRKKNLRAESAIEAASRPSPGKVAGPGRIRVRGASNLQVLDKRTLGCYPSVFPRPSFRGCITMGKGASGAGPDSGEERRRRSRTAPARRALRPRNVTVPAYVYVRRRMRFHRSRHANSQGRTGLRTGTKTRWHRRGVEARRRRSRSANSQLEPESRSSDLARSYGLEVVHQWQARALRARDAFIELPLCRESFSPIPARVGKYFTWGGVRSGISAGFQLCANGINSMLRPFRSA